MSFPSFKSSTKRVEPDSKPLVATSTRLDERLHQQKKVKTEESPRENAPEFDIDRKGDFDVFKYDGKPYRGSIPKYTRSSNHIIGTLDRFAIVQTGDGAGEFRILAKNKEKGKRVDLIRDIPRESKRVKSGNLEVKKDYIELPSSDDDKEEEENSLVKQSEKLNEHLRHVCIVGFSCLISLESG